MNTHIIPFPLSSVPPRRRRPSLTMTRRIKPTMTEAGFWQLIAESRARACGSEGLVEVVIDELARLELGAIFGFEEVLGDLTDSLRCEISGLGDLEELDYARIACWLVCQGRDAFEHILAEPDDLLKMSQELQSTARLLSAPLRAFQRKTGSNGLSHYYELRCGLKLPHFAKDGRPARS